MEDSRQLGSERQIRSTSMVILYVDLLRPCGMPETVLTGPEMPL